MHVFTESVPANFVSSKVSNLMGSILTRRRRIRIHTCTYFGLRLRSNLQQSKVLFQTLSFVNKPTPPFTTFSECLGSLQRARIGNQLVASPSTKKEFASAPTIDRSSAMVPRMHLRPVRLLRQPPGADFTARRRGRR